MATLILTEGPSADRKFALESNALTMIGRSDECTFQIVDPRVSRKHVQLRREDDGSHTILKYSKSNRVYLNGEELQDEATLGDGDEVRIGDTTMVYTTNDDADAQTARDAWFKKGQRFKTSMGDGDGPPVG